MNITKKEFGFVTYSFFYLFSLYLTLLILASSFYPEYQASIIAALDFEIAICMLFANVFIEKVTISSLAKAAPILVTILLALPFFTTGLISLISVFILAPIISIGFLFFFRFFKQTTAPIGQARLAGIIAFLVLPLVFFLGGVSPDAVNYVFIFGFMFISSLGMIIALQKRPKPKVVENEPEAVSERKVIILYLIPWVLFSIVNATLAKNLTNFAISQTSTVEHSFLIALQIIGVNVGAIIASLISDFLGRKISLALTLILYGIASILCGVIAIAQVFPLVYLINGVSWGILFVMYIFVIWSDLSSIKNSAKIFTLGAVTYFGSLGFGRIMPEVVLPADTTALLISFSMFLSILPIFLSPELMPADYLEKLKLSRYVKKIKKLST